MANEVIGIDVQVSLEQLRAQLATLGPGMDKEAKAMTAALNKEIKKQTAAMKAASKATSQVRTDSIKDVAAATAAVGTKFDKLAKAAGPLGGVLARISPEAGAAASALAGLTGAAEGVAAGLGTSMAGALGAMAAVLAPAALAVAVLTANMKYEAAQADASAASHKTLNEALQFTKQLADGTADAMLDLKVKVGQMAPEEAAYAKAVKAVTDESDAQIAKIEGWIASRKALGGAWGAEVKMLREAQEDTKKLTADRLLLIKADAQWATHTRESEEFIAARDKAAAKAAAEATKAAARAAEAAARAAEAAAMEQKANADAAAEKLAVSKMIEKNRDEVTTRQLERLEEEEEAEKRARAYIATLVQSNLAVQKKSAEEAAAHIRSVAAASTATLDSLLGAMHQFASLAADEAAEAAEKAADRLSNISGLLAELTAEQVDASTLTGDALVKAYKRGEVGVEELSEAQKASIASALSAQEDAAAKRARSERKAARAAWQTQQDLNIAQTFAAGAVALIQAFAQLGPVAGAIAGIGIAAATAASIATISSQKPAFHSGGVVGGSANGQGEVSARLLPGEALLNRQATNALGPSGVAALNSGASMGAVSLRIGRLEAREIVRTDVAAGGLIVRTAKSAAASAGNTAGRTGRRPIA